MIERIELAEYETKRVSITRTDAALLRSLAGRRLGVQPTEESGCYELTAGSHVGTIRLPTTHLIVRPKVSMANLFHLLEADGDPLTVGKELVAYETDADLLPAFASVYTHLQERTLARGLRHEYQEREELLVGVRGRFDVAGQQRRAGLPLPTACRFDEYTPDTVWNRTLRAATERLARLPGVAAVTRRNLFRHLVMLEEVGPLAPGDRAHPLTFTRLDAHYRAAVQLARLILDGTAIVDRLGGRTAGVFFVNMNVVFERFVEARLRQCLRGRVRVEGQAISTLDDHRHVAIQPDLVFRDAGRALFVGDAKYKLAEQGIGRQSDYYQLLAYTTAYAVGEGVLIYCRDDGAPPAAEVVVRHSGARLHTRAVYLGSSPKEIDLQLAAIAEWIANRTAAASN